MTTTSTQLLDGIVAGITDHMRGNHYNPGVELCADNADWLDGYSHGWNTALTASREHNYTVREIGGHGYPYRAVCPCGWQSTTSAAAHAAGQMGDYHVEEQAMRNISTPAAGRWGATNHAIRAN